MFWNLLKKVYFATKTVVCKNCNQNVYYEDTKPKKCPYCGSPL